MAINAGIPSGSVDLGLGDMAYGGDDLRGQSRANEDELKKKKARQEQPAQYGDMLVNPQKISLFTGYGGMGGR